MFYGFPLPLFIMLIFRDINFGALSAEIWPLYARAKCIHVYPLYTFVNDSLDMGHIIKIASDPYYGHMGKLYINI